MPEKSRLSPTGEVGALRLPDEPSSVGVARAFVRETLAGLGPQVLSADDDLVDTACLLTSELVTNAVLHAHTPVGIRVLAGDGAVRIEVADESERAPMPRQRSAESTTGRGLDIVQLVASRCGVEWTRAGKVMWFVLTAEQAAPGAGWEGLDAPRRGELRRVRLLGLPVALYQAMRDHNAALLREYSLARLEDSTAGASAAGPSDEHLSAADHARLVTAEAFDRWLAAQDPQRPLPEQVDIDADLDPADAKGFRHLQEAFDAAEALADAGRLLTRPALPEVRQLREWCVHELLTQLAGGAPHRWAPEDLPLTRAAVTADEDIRRRVDAPGASLVAGDTSNRILAVSAAVARMLGWDPSELVGHRIVAIIPPALRRTHVAGFTRHIVTGQARILDRPVPLDAWHRAGHRVPIVLTITERRTASGVVFLAELRPRTVRAG